MASIHTPSDHIKVTESVVDDLAGQTTGAGRTSVDCRGFRRALVILGSEAMGGASPTYDVKLQDSADDVTFADVTGGAFTQITTANDASLFLMDVDLTKRARFLRAHTTAGGTTPTGASAVIFCLMQARTQNPTQDETVKSV